MSTEQSFGQLVKTRRRELGLTQDELARRVGCAPVTLRKIEYDDLRPSVQIAERLAMALNIALEERAAFVRLARTERQPEPITPTPAPRPEEIGTEDLTGKAIRGYALGERIGNGGMGAVYRATQPHVEREVAIKIILPQYANHPDFIRRFEAEAQLVARLEHPHIVPLYDYWREPGSAYLIMRLLRGGSVRGLLEKSALPIEQTIRLVEQIGSALSVAHRAGVIHRDLKPGNVLLDEDGNAYLADFGIAKNLSNPNLEDMTQADAIVGSPAYISPEQIRSEFVRPQTDIYCLGVMLYELLTGTVPFAGPTPIEVMHQHLSAPLPPLAANRSGLPAALDAVIERATAKDPLERYSDIESLLSDLRRAIGRVKGGGLEIGELGHSFQSSTSPILTADDNPYKGLRAFGEGDAADFFGREALTQQLLVRMGEGGDLSRFLAVVGPSGSGKSSVVGAGLVPALRRGALPGSDQWFIVEMMPGPHPLEELEAALLRIAVNPPESLLSQLREDKRGLLRAVRRCLPENESVELVLVIDQFEEVFTLVQDEAVRAHFLDSLVTAALDERSRVRVLVTLRADFTDRPLGYVDFGELLRQRSEFVLPLTPDELERAIIGPAERVGLQLEPGLVTAILHDVSDQPGALPLLQYALTELFEKREGNTLTKKAYAEIGGVLGALGRRAEEVFASLDADGQALARQLFLRLVTLGEGAEDTRRRVLRAELESLAVSPHPQPLPRSQSARTGEGGTPSPVGVLPTGEGRGGGLAGVIESFGKHRLLSFDRDPVTRGPTVEVAHEALLREWPRLYEWLNESRADVRLQRQLATAAAEWQSANRDVSFLLSGTRLAQFEGWAASTTVALTRDEQAYLEAGIAEREKQETAEQARQKRELEAARKLAETERQRAEEQVRYVARVRTRNRAIAIAGAIASVLAILAGLFGWQSSQNATLARQNLSAAQIANTQSAANAAAAQAASTLAFENASAAQNAQATAQANEQSRATQQAIAEANFTRAEARRLAAEANSLVLSEGNSQRAALLSIRSLNIQYTEEGINALVEANKLAFPLRLFVGHTDTIFAVDFSPDGKYIATASYDNTARLWDAQTGQELRRFTGHSSVVSGIAFSPDGRYLFTSSADGTAQRWDAQTGENLWSSSNYGNLVLDVAVSPDGKYIVIGTYQSARLLDAQTGQEVQAFLGHTDFVKSVAFSSDGQYVLTGSDDRTARLYKAQTGQELRVFTDHTNAVSGVAFSPDGQYAFTGSFDKTARLWDIQTGQVLRFFTGHTGAIQNVALSLDGKYALTAGWDKTTRLWDVQTGQQLRVFTGHVEWVSGVAFSPDGKYVLTSGGDQEAWLWDIGVEDELPQLVGHKGGVNGVAFSPDGKHLLTGSGDAEAWLWDAKSGQKLHVFRHDDIVNHGVAFSPDGKYILTSSWDRSVRLWDAQTFEEVRRFIGHTDAVNGVAFSPDGKYIATTSHDTTARLWDAQTGKELQRFIGHNARVHSVVFSQDGQYLLTGSWDNTARLWDAQTGEELRRFTGHTDYVNGVAFSPDEKYVATASHDKTARLWDAQTSEELQRFSGHTFAVWSVVFSPDGKYLFTGSDDTTTRVWDIKTGHELRRFTGHTGGVNWLTFSPDGKFLATASNDNSVLLWSVDYYDTVHHLCSQLSRDFTDDERAQYNLPNDGPTCP